MQRIADKFKTISILSVMIYMRRHIEVSIPCRRYFAVTINRTAIFPNTRFEPDNLTIDDETEDRSFALRPDLDGAPYDVTPPWCVRVPS